MCTYIFFSVHIYIFIYFLYIVFSLGRKQSFRWKETLFIVKQLKKKKKETLDCGGSHINLLKFHSHLSANWPLVGPQEHVGEYQTQKNVNLACFMKIRSCNFFQQVA